MAGKHREDSAAGPAPSAQIRKWPAVGDMAALMDADPPLSRDELESLHTVLPFLTSSFFFSLHRRLSDVRVELAPTSSGPLDGATEPRSRRKKATKEGNWMFFIFCFALFFYSNG